MSAVTSRQHAIVKKFRAAGRVKDRLLLLDGWHLIGEAVAAGLTVRHVAVRGEPARDGQRVLDRLEASGAEVTAVSAPVMDALSPVRTSSGVAAIADRPTVDLQALAQPHPALILVGFSLQDPGNVGAVIRSADAGGATGVLLDGASADPWSWKALRASMGSAFRLPVRREANAIDAVTTWRGQGMSIVAAHPRGAVAMESVDLSTPTVLLFGGEGLGLPTEALELAGLRAAIPMRPPVESLNVAVAAALLVYEARRQRT